jgi:nitrite reductase/ring-hydroxylating ferredoxin subunit
MICTLSGIPDPGAREFEVGGGDWPFRGFLVRRRGGLYAYANVCPHRGHPLNLTPEGFFTPDGKLLRCASHGAVFVPESGFCLGGPCVGQSLASLGCRVADGSVLVIAPDSMRGG